MRRREFVTLAVCGTPAWLSVALAQQPGVRRRIGYLSGGTEEARRTFLNAFRQGMRSRGYIESKDFSIEARYANGKFELLPGLARSLLDEKLDLLLVSTTPASLVAKAATSTIPIVMVAVADPIGVGLIQSLSRPGGNITGITNIAAELAGKRLDILTQIVPKVSRVAILINPDDPNATLQMRSAETAAVALVVELQPVLAVRSASDLNVVFKRAVEAGAGAALRMVDPLENALRAQTVALAAQYRLPVIYPFREAVALGGLVSYGTDLADQYRQAAELVHRILNGEKPSDLPVERPTKFQLAINRTTAKALGLAIPPTLLTTADEVID